MNSGLCRRSMSAVFSPIIARVAAGVFVFIVASFPNAPERAESGIVFNGA